MTTLYIQLVNNDDNMHHYYNNLVNTYDIKALRVDSGIDLYTPNDVIIKGRSSYLVDLHVRTQINARHGYILLPRSSIGKTPLILTNSVGVIDYGYQGNLKAYLYNTSTTDYLITKGTCLMQLCLPTLEPFVSVKLVNDITQINTPSLRGDGGFGSTNK